MSSATLYAAIRDRLDEEWTATAVAYRNEAFTVPDDGAGNALPWLMVGLTSQSFRQVSIGAGARTDNRWRRTGTLNLTIFVPSNTGSASADSLLDQAVDLFRGQDLGATTFTSVDFPDGNSQEMNGTWWALPAHISFETDE